MTAVLWLLLGFAVWFPPGVLAGYVWADRHIRHVPLFPHPHLNSDEEPR